MKGIVQHRYGPAERLHYTDIQLREPRAGEVSVRIAASSINAYDWHYYTGTPYFARFVLGWPRPKNPIVGADFAGVVEATATDVTLVKPGDRVVGEVRAGAWATNLVCEANKLVPLPDSIPLEDAACLPMAGSTALQALRDHARIKPGMRVLINGASGGVGTFAIQIARLLGAEVWAVCSQKNTAQVLGLGAHHVIVYNQQDVRVSGLKFDALADQVGNLSYADYHRLLTAEGRGVMVGYQNMKILMGVMLRQRKEAKKGKPAIISFTAEPRPADLRQLVDWMAEGNLRTIISHRYPLTQAAVAAALQQEGHTAGKVVLFT